MRTAAGAFLGGSRLESTGDEEDSILRDAISNGEVMSPICRKSQTKKGKSP